MRIVDGVLEKLSKVEVRRALGFVWESGPRWLIVNTVLVFARSIMPLATLYLTKLVLDAVTAALAMDDRAAGFSSVATFVVLLGVATLVNRVFGLGVQLVGEIQAQLVADHMYDLMEAKSAEVDLEYYENASYYDTFQRAREEAPSRPTRIVNGLVSVGLNSFSLLIMIGLLASFNWGVAALLFVAALPGMLARLQYADKLHNWQRSQTAKSRLAYYFNWILTGNDHAKENRLFNLGGLFMQRSQRLRGEMRAERIAISVRYYFKELITELSSVLAVFLSYGFIAYQTVMGHLTLGDLVMYFQAFQRAQGYLEGVFGGVADLYENSLFLSNVYEFLDLKRTLIEPAHPQPVPRPMRRGIEFDHVTFHYPTGTRPVIEDISLRVEPGEVVALVGENGSGKTTLIKLLCRLYDPTSGSIAIDGIPLQSFATTDLRQEISIIFQDYAHYYLTARDNIWLGNVDLPTDDPAIEVSAQYSGADEVIRSLKDGYDTVLGKWFANGEELSIGEWQKVALARAFLRDSQLIVLDEPTSAMDPKAEFEVFEKFRELLKGRTAILISHRLSTVRMADRIYVLQDGRLLENGTHDELIESAGTYARMFETQAQAYREAQPDEGYGI